MSEALRRSVRGRAGGRCEYCQLPDWLPPLEPFHLEHIMARQHGGTLEPENLAWEAIVVIGTKGLISVALIQTPRPSFLSFIRAATDGENTSCWMEPAYVG